MDKVQEENRYYNWYQSLTQLRLPTIIAQQLKFEIWTRAINGSVAMQYFGDKFNSSLVEKKIAVEIYVYPVRKTPKQNAKAVLNFQIDKISLPDTKDWRMAFARKTINPDLAYFFKNFTIPLPNNGFRKIEQSTNITQQHIDAVKMKRMPGFKLRWHYNKEVVLFKNFAFFKSFSPNRAFIRCF